MTSFSEFDLKMEHELENVPFSLTTTGYKIDGQGIKRCCSLNDYKSIDYIYHKSDKYYLIEFSDLYRQQDGIVDLIENIRHCDLSRPDKKKLIKEQDKKIRAELVDKLKGCHSIFNQMNKKIKDIPDEFLSSNKEYLIVISPIDTTLEEDRKADLIRLIDTVVDKIKTAIPDDIFAGVRLLEINNFVVFSGQKLVPQKWRTTQLGYSSEIKK